jgi:hypothetical protein
VNDLVRWLGEQLEEDERIAKRAVPGPWRHEPDRPDPPLGTPGSEEAIYAGPIGPSEARIAGTGMPGDRQSYLNAVHIAEHDPERVFNEITFKCKLHAWALNSLRREAPDQVEKVIRLIAETYRHRPGYREEWRP